MESRLSGDVRAVLCGVCHHNHALRGNYVHECKQSSMDPRQDTYRQ